MPTELEEQAFLRPNAPVEFEARNPRRAFRHTETLGDIYTLNFEIDEQTWRAVAVIPKTASLTMWLVWNDGDEPERKAIKHALVSSAKPQAQKKNGSKPRKVRKGENGAFWNKLIKRGFWTFPGVRETLHTEAEGQTEVLCAMRREFDTDTLALVSPEQAAEWAGQRGLEGFMNLIRHVQANLEG